MKRDELKINADGLVITDVLRSWHIAPIAGIGVLLAFRHADHPTDNDNECTVTQLGLTIRQCLDLADALKRQAEELLRTPPNQKLT